MIDTVCPIGSGRRSPASCSSSNATSILRMMIGVVNGTSCSAWITDSSSFAGIISGWYIAIATYSAGSVSASSSAR